MIMSKNVLFSGVNECLSACLQLWEASYAQEWIKTESESSPLHQAIFEVKY